MHLFQHRSLFTQNTCRVLYSIEYSPAAPVDGSLGEPFYIDPIRSSELYESIREAQMYEVPTSSLDRTEPEARAGHEYHVLDGSRVQKRGSPEEDNDDTDDYQTVAPPPSPPVGHDYQELEAPNSLTDEEHSHHTTPVSTTSIASVNEVPNAKDSFKNFHLIYYTHTHIYPQQHSISDGEYELYVPSVVCIYVCIASLL